MVAMAILSICITYNLLGGIRTIAGLGFTFLALNTFVISQVVKVLLLERADENLDAPALTIAVYGVFYLFVMLGTFVFSRIRLPLPKPAEPETTSQRKYLYYISLVGGVGASLILLRLDFEGANLSFMHAVARALSYLLPFSLVLAVDIRIRKTNGRHSLGLMALWPTLTFVFLSFVSAGRAPFIEPLAVIFLTCYLRCIQFRRKHVVAAIAALLFFFGYLSPYYLYAREFRGRITIRDQVATMVTVLISAPVEWGTIQRTVGERALTSPGAVNYFASPAAVTLNRFSLIGPDSTLIGACSAGFHYGLTALKLDFLTSMPRVLFPDKPQYGSNTYLGQLDGQESDVFETTTNSTITPISDSFGAFGWLGVTGIAFFLIPAIFIVYESMFDASRPWGTVATFILLIGMAGGSLGSMIFETLIKAPLYIVGISLCAAWIVRLIPTGGDHATNFRLGSGSNYLSGNQPRQTPESVG